MLKKLFTSSTRVKLLKLFFMNREREFYLRELSRITGENPNSIKRELKNLKSIGLITERKRGNQKLYRVNKLSPIHEELRKIVLKTVGIGEVLRENLVKFGVKFALIYGSFAQGEEVKDSDIDLLIIGDVDEEELIKIIKKLEEELSREINYILWNRKEFRKRIKEKHHLLMDVIEKPFIMIIGDADEFRSAVKGKGYKKD